jgi:hypothetical protein
MASGTSLERLARAIKRSNTSTPAWLPRGPQVTMHQGTVTRVDTYNGVVDFQFPDPSGLIVPSVRFIQPYTTDNPPLVGDVVWAQHYGTDFLVMGQHMVLGGTVVVD